jgi:UDP-3-O-acyl N-acetylglucosamine deacetylase
MSSGWTVKRRPQRTIRRSVSVAGIGYLTCADVQLSFRPAPPHHGVTFQRVDCPDSQPIPATIDYTVPRQRRTAISRDGVTVEMTEHVLAALAGLQIDNCRVELDAAETPGFDGSAQAFVEALLSAEIVPQDADRPVFVVSEPLRVVTDDGSAEIIARPYAKPLLALSYQLDYGPRSPIKPQTLSMEMNPGAFLKGLAFARTFVLEAEVAALRAQGYGSRTTTGDLLVFGPDGVIGNNLRAPDECVRHKMLDCLGDFALLGCDIHGHFEAYRSGHELNREVVRRLQHSLDPTADLTRQPA